MDVVVPEDELTSSNPNIAWTRLFVEELTRCGLESVCIAPGSRSTPLALAFAQSRVRIHRHLDERSAAFYALGLAMATDAPVAVVCTSGTAAANFYPAVIEAFHSNVPLLLLTADRPPELRYSGANQTIDQVKMYADHVLWSVDVPTPQADAPSLAVRSLQTLAARAYARANGIVKGPVHLNFPFRKPLEPSGEEQARWRSKLDILRSDSVARRPHTSFSLGELAPRQQQVDTLREVISENERGLIVCGPRCPNGDFPEAVTLLSRLSGYPLFADVLSGVRFGPHVESAPVVGGYDTFLSNLSPDWEDPQVVIRFGAVPTSNALNAYLDKVQPAHHVHISQDGIWADDSHRTSLFIHADPTLFCHTLAQTLDTRPLSDWARHLLEIEEACWKATGEALEGERFDGNVVTEMVATLPPGVRLFAGNSLPVRHLDQFSRPSGKPVQVFANRGASGIDGNVSTAFGIRAAGNGPVVALMGDITFYHDLNGLLAARDPGNKMTVVVLNNNGGGIFHRLPIASLDPPFQELFLTPHDLNFEPVVRMYGLDYVCVSVLSQFQGVFAECMEDDVTRVIEVRTDGKQDHALRLALLAHASQRIYGRVPAEGSGEERMGAEAENK